MSPLIHIHAQYVRGRSEELLGLVRILCVHHVAKVSNIPMKLLKIRMFRAKQIHVGQSMNLPESVWTNDQ